MLILFLSLFRIFMRRMNHLWKWSIYLAKLSDAAAKYFPNLSRPVGLWTMKCHSERNGGHIKDLIQRLMESTERFPLALAGPRIIDQEMTKPRKLLTMLF